MRLLPVALAAAVTLAAPSSAAYTRFTSRSASYALVANCPAGPLGDVCSPGHSVPFGSFPDYAGTEDLDATHEGTDTATFARLLPPTGTQSYGSAIAYTVVEPGDLTPTLKAGAFTRPNNLGRYTTSFAFVSTLFAYTYGGAAAVVLPLVGTLDATITFAPINYAAPLGAGSYPYSFGQLSGRLAVVSESTYSGTPLDPDALTCGSVGVLSTGGGAVVRGGYASGAMTQNVSLSFDLSTGCNGTALTLTPGERFYIFAFMSVLGAQGGTTDATHSFNIDLAPGTPPAVLQALAQGASLVTAVPEPANWALMIGGFGLTGGALRRQRAIAAR